MALSVLDGNQSATTLSSVVTGGEHIVAHSVVSLGSNAISNITTAVSGSTVCVGNLGLLQSTVATEGLSASGSFIKIGGHSGTSTTGNIVHVSAVGALRVDGSVYTQPVSIASVTIGNTVTIAGTVTANPTGTQTIAGTIEANGGDFASIVGDSMPAKAVAIGFYSGDDAGIAQVNDSNRKMPISGTVTLGAGTAQIGSVTASISNSLTISSLPAISGTVTANLANVVTTDSFWGTQAVKVTGGGGYGIDIVGIDSNSTPTIIQEGGGIPVYPRDNSGLNAPFPISGTVTIGSALPTGTNRIGVVTIGGGTVTLGASTSQIGSVTASISNSVVTFYPMQGTTVTNSNFTSTTASTTLVSAVANREVLTVFNEGAGNLHISPGATATTISYQVRLSPGDYWECPAGQLSLAHTAVFATSGTARVTEVS